MFITTECRGCQGTGQSFDATNLDNAVGADPSGIVKCSACRGKGEIQRLPAPEAMIRETEVIRARQATEPIGEMPDWMC